MFDQKIISISGNARVGKDTMADFFVEILNDLGIKAQKVSFAYALRKSVDDFLLREIGISAFTQDDEEKKIIRPFLVFWGDEVMRKIDDNIWVKKIEEYLSPNQVNIVADLRFENELNWVKQHKGFSLFLDRDNIGPANEYEEKHNAILRTKTDCLWNIANVEDTKILKPLANEILENLITKEAYDLWKATCH